MTLTLRTPMKAHSLQDLKQIQTALATAQAKAVAEAVVQAEKARKAYANKNLFVLAAGAVSPLPNKPSALLKKEQPDPIPKQTMRDEEAVMVEALSDEFDITTLLEVDATLSFRRPGIGADVLRKLRKGDWSIQREIDLHGLRREEARDALSIFVREAFKQGLRCVRVVHGKGLGSPGKAPVLKSKVQSWLVQKEEVLAYVQAKPSDGGAGALVVLLQAGRTAH
jgi:DNA-nicking Smr family endonuclease